VSVATATATGRSRSLSGPTKPDPPLGLPLTQDQWLYFFTLAVAITLYLAATNLIRTRTGRAMMAIRDNPLAARSMGINNPIYKAVTFGVSGLYTGIAGALSAKMLGPQTARVA
jgi:branched-chain amino acid transport system permease protein